MLKAALRDSLIYGLASVMSKGIIVLMIPLYTRVLSPSDYGAYDLMISFGVLINLTVALEITQGISRFWSETIEGVARKKLASTTLWFSIFMYSIFLIVSLLASTQLNKFILGDDNYLVAFRLGLGFIAANGIYYLLINQFRWELRSKQYARISVVYALFILLFTFLFCLMMDMRLVGIMLAQLLSALLAILLSLWYLRKSFGWHFDTNQLRLLLSFSAPLVPAGLAAFISLYFNRITLNHFNSLEEIGYFGFGSRIAGLVVLLIIGIQAALTPLIYQHHRETQTPKQISQLFSWFMAVALLGCLFLASFSKELVVLFATAEYKAGGALVGVLAPSLLLSQMYIFAPGIAIEKKTHWQLWVTLLSAAVSAGANWLFVPIWGIWGAAIATLMSSIVFFLFWLNLSQTLYRIPYRWKPICLSSAIFLSFIFIANCVDKLELGLIETILLKIIIIIVQLIVILYTGLISKFHLSELLLFTKIKLKL